MAIQVLVLFQLRQISATALLSISMQALNDQTIRLRCFKSALTALRHISNNLAVPEVAVQLPQEIAAITVEAAPGSRVEAQTSLVHRLSCRNTSQAQRSTL
ncbi:hypothetical protein D9M68_733570 [compost metagenome]